MPQPLWIPKQTSLSRQCCRKRESEAWDYGEPQLGREVSKQHKHLALITEINMDTKQESVTLEVGGAQLTVSTKELFRAWFEKHIFGVTLNGIQMPELRAGEKWAGIYLDENGKAVHHVILLPGFRESINWKDAVEWAESIGGVLPDRCEQALLYAFMKAEFKPVWHWSSEQHVAASDCAWLQTFDDGYQNDDLKISKFSARAVRRSPI